ncbi:MAG: ribbon-helix-helix protein, CopG family [Patescibacteria group bacterium]
METSQNTAMVGVAPRGRRGRALRSGKTSTKRQVGLSPVKGRRRFSITLSPKSAEAFDWLKDATDADTDSEVIRNALRMHYVLLQRHIEGDTFFLCPANKPDQMVKIDLFVAK